MLPARAAAVRERPRDTRSTALRRVDFTPLAVNGWGDGYNSYAHSMAWFQDRLYVGAARANLHLGRLRTTAPQWPIYPVKCPDDLLSLDVRARIWRWDPKTLQWENVHVAGVVKSRDGRDIPAEIGYRGMTVFRGPGDDAPVLYASSYSGWGALRDQAAGLGPMVFRSEDGTRFTPVSAPGLGREGISAFRSLVPFNGRLYTSPVGTIRNRPNASPCPVVFESLDPARGLWRPVSEPGFGNKDNVAIFEMAAFNGYLYAGAGNIRTGFELWKTDAEGEPPYRWTQVIRLGAYRGNLNEGVLSLCVFNDALYIGTAIQDGGYDREFGVGPDAGELLRVHPDDTWDLVAGTSRLTPYGAKVATSGLQPGFNNFSNGYIWRMCVHQGRLYVGTFDWSGYIQYFAVDKWPEGLRRFIDKIGLDEAVGREGGFDLLRTRDGDRWHCVTRTGFDNPYNSGVRTMVSTPHGLAVGTVNPFGPEVAVKKDGRWEYVPNPRGGLEVWLGRRERRPGDAADDLDDELLEPAAGPAGDLRTGPILYRKREIDPAELEWSAEDLKKAARRVDVQSVRPDFVSFAHRLHHIRAEGIERLPAEGPVLIASNHVGSPILAGTTFVPEDSLLLAHLLLGRLGRPARILADPRYYGTRMAVRANRESADMLGFVPHTEGNGLRLLQMGEVVVIHPEGGYSRPDYALRPFAADFARLALESGAPLVPLAVVGPYESRQRVERGGQVLYLNQTPLPEDYAFLFLPPIDVRDRLGVPRDARARAGDPPGGRASALESVDGRALESFCDEVRLTIQRAVDEEGGKRPLFAQVRALQRTYGAGA